MAGSPLDVLNDREKPQDIEAASAVIQTARGQWGPLDSVVSRRSRDMQPPDDLDVPSLNDILRRPPSFAQSEFETVGSLSLLLSAFSSLPIVLNLDHSQTKEPHSSLPKNIEQRNCAESYCRRLAIRWLGLYYLCGRTT